MIPSESRRRHGCAYWTATTLGFEEPTSRIRVTCSWKTRSRNSCITGLQLQACGCSFEPRRARPGDVEHVQIHVRVHDSQSDHRKSAVRSLEAPPCRQLPGTETPPRPRSRRRLRLRVSGPAVRSRTALGGRGPRRAGGRLAASATPRGPGPAGRSGRERDSFFLSLWTARSPGCVMFTRRSAVLATTDLSTHVYPLRTRGVRLAPALRSAP